MTKIHAKARTCPHCRALIVSRVLDDGQSPSSVARDFRVTSPTVRKWIRRFQSDGATGLDDKSSAPRSVPRRQTQPGPALHDAVMRLLHMPPAEYGLNRTCWRLTDLRSVLIQQGVVATLKCIRATISDAGVRWKQARVALTSQDPDYRQKVDAIKAVLSRLAADEAFFSIDEMGPVAVKMRGGLSLQLPGQVRSVPQWQRSKGFFILTAALDLAANQVIYFFSDRKNTAETIRLVDRLRDMYASYRCLYLSWDAAPWHSSVQLMGHVQLLNERAPIERRPIVEFLPLPRSAQFLNVIESVFSGMARAIIHNSDYESLEAARSAIARYLDERNAAFAANPRAAGRTIWGHERVPSKFDEANNCKDPRWI